AEVARLLEAEELLQGAGNERRSVRLANEVQKRVLSNGSPTGIRDGRSYDPREALGSVYGASLFFSKALAFQEVDLFSILDHRRAVKIRAVPGGQGGQRLPALCGVECRGRVVDEDGGPEAQRIVDEVAIGGAEQVVLPPVGQGRAQRVAARLREDVGLE